MLNITINCETFAIAVSGGVDSMVLLDIVRQQCSPQDFVVAHFTHGIRSRAESELDKRTVSEYCQKYDLRCEFGEATPTLRMSEADARKARYRFLRGVIKQYNYNTIITAHHQDDMIETAIINLLRGTTAKGLVSLGSDNQLMRPLLHVSKADIIAYAEAHNLNWHEDRTNHDQRFLRNYVRRNIVPSLKQSGNYEQLLQLVRQHQPIQAEMNQILQHIERVLVKKTDEGATFNRQAFIVFDHAVAREFVRYLFTSFDLGKAPTSSTIDKLVTFIKTAKIAASIDISRTSRLTIGKTDVILNIRNRAYR